MTPEVLLDHLGTADLLVWAVLTPVGLWLAIIDLRTHTLPTRIIAPLYALCVVVFGANAVLHEEWHDAVRAVIGWAVLGGCYWLLWRFSPQGMGYGDVRLAGVLGLALGHVGWPEFVAGLYLPFLFGGLWAVVALLRRRRDQAFAFGPFMVVGALLAIALGPRLVLLS